MLNSFITTSLKSKEPPNLRHFSFVYSPYPKNQTTHNLQIHTINSLNYKKGLFCSLTQRRIVIYVFSTIAAAECKPILRFVNIQKIPFQNLYLSNGKLSIINFLYSMKATIIQPIFLFLFDIAQQRQKICHNFVIFLVKSEL